MRGIFALGITILLLFGCVSSDTKLGLTTEAACDNPTPPKPPLRDSEKIACYHQAAISEAYLQNPDEAVNTCSDIVNKIGDNHPNDDIGAQAETERNLCYFDIAKIIARETDTSGQTNMQQVALNVCSNIRDSTTHSLTGAAATQDTCVSEVNKQAAITAQQYYASPNNICTITFILPFVLAFALFEWKKRGS